MTLAELCSQKLGRRRHSVQRGGCDASLMSWWVQSLGLIVNAGVGQKITRIVFGNECNSQRHIQPSNHHVQQPEEEKKSPSAAKIGTA